MEKSPRILIIDDDPNIRKTLSDILKLKGFEVASAGTGAEGIEQARREFASVALIDLKLPDMSGLDVLARIKADSPSTSAIILTGFASMDSAIEASKKGAFSYVLKPYEIDELLQHIHHGVEHQQSEEKLHLSEQRYRRLFEAAREGIVVVDDETGQIVDANHFMLNLLDAGLDEVLEKKLWEIRPFRNVISGLADFRELQKKGQVSYDDLPFDTADGRELHVDVTISTYVLNGGKAVQCRVSDITERMRQQAKIKRLNSLLLTIRDINEYLLVTENEDELFNFVCTSLKKLDGVGGVLIGLKSSNLEVKPACWSGLPDEIAQSLNIRWDDSEHGRGIVGTAIRLGRTDVVDDLGHDDRYTAWRDVVDKLHLKSGAAVPLKADDEVSGALAIYSDRVAAFDEETVRFLAEVATDVAVGLRSLQLDKKLRATLYSIRKTLDGTVQAIATMVELRDPYTAGHERRVAELACAIGEELGLSERRIEGLRVAGFMHDIGKVAIPAEILSKPTALTDNERLIVNQHPQAGYDILKNLEFPWPVAQMVLQHHERMDGSGYPNHTRGEDIIQEARILMVADTVEAMASHRPYRPARGMELALGEIKANRGKLYDAEVVDACLRLIEDKGFRWDRQTDSMS